MRQVQWFAVAGVGGGLVPSLDFKSNGRPMRSAVGSIPTYSRQSFLKRSGVLGPLALYL
jgi:hypothetical protein